MAYKDKSQAVKYGNDYNRAKYDRVTVMLCKGGKDTVKELAALAGQSVNEYIKDAIADRAKRDGHNIDI